MLQPFCHAFWNSDHVLKWLITLQKKDYKAKVHQKNLPYENPFPFNYKRIPEAVKLFLLLSFLTSFILLSVQCPCSFYFVVVVVWRKGRSVEYGCKFLEESHLSL